MKGLDASLLLRRIHFGMRLDVVQRPRGQMEEIERQRATSEDKAQKMDELKYRIAPLERLFRQKSSAFDELWQQLDNTESELRMREQRLELAELSQSKTETDLCLCSRELEATRTRAVEYNQACADYSSGRIAERDRHLELKDAMIRDLQQEGDQALQLLEVEQYARKEMNNGSSTKLTSSRQADWIPKEHEGPALQLLDTRTTSRNEFDDAWDAHHRINLSERDDLEAEVQREKHEKRQRDDQMISMKWSLIGLDSMRTK
ncbi:MAG: hypothetical protein Q9164_002927 [Protoblastenia rupestris]